MSDNSCISGLDPAKRELAVSLPGLCCGGAADPPLLWMQLGTTMSNDGLRSLAAYAASNSTAIKEHLISLCQRPVMYACLQAQSRAPGLSPLNRWATDVICDPHAYSLVIF